MKSFGKMSVLAVVATLSLGSQAFALDLVTSGGLVATGASVGGTAGAILIGVGVGTTTYDLTVATANAKDAVYNAAPDAVVVAQGGEATPAFMEGKAAAEFLNNTKFASDVEAAYAILQISENIEE